VSAVLHIANKYEYRRQFIMPPSPTHTHTHARVHTHMHTQ